MLLLAFIAAAQWLPIGKAIDAAQEWVRSLGAWGPLAFGAVFVLGGVTLVPGALLTIPAGSLFGIALGTLVVSIASTVSALLSFVIARSLARDRIQALAESSPRFRALDQAIQRGGWKMVGLLRLSPIFPFSVGNYLYGLTGVGLGPYLVASWVGMLPGTVMYVYLGHAGASALDGRERSPLEWGILVVGLIASVAFFVYLSVLARRAASLHRSPSSGSSTAG